MKIQISNPTVGRDEPPARPRRWSSLWRATRRVAPTSIALVLVGSALGADWPAWRGPQRNGISTEKVNAANLKPLWKTNVGIGCATVSIANGRLYTMGNRDNTDIVWCLDAATGKVLWKHEYAEPLAPKLYEGGPNATPTVDPDTRVGAGADVVFTLSKSGKLFCLRADTGKVVWSKNLTADYGINLPGYEGKEGWGHAGSALVNGNMLLIEGGALNKTTGTLLWKCDETTGYGSPIVFNNNRVAFFNAKGLTIRDLATGKLIAEYPWKTSYNVNAATPIIDPDTSVGAGGYKIFIASGYNHGAALLKFDGKTLTLLWETKKMRNQLSSSVLWRGHLYGIDENIFTCMDFATGEVKWTGGAVIKKGSLMMADGKLIVLGEKGNLVIAEATPSAYKELACVKVVEDHCWSMPVLANGRLYCKSSRPGDLVCLDVK